MRRPVKLDFLACGTHYALTSGAPSAATVLAASLVPALRASRLAPVDALAEE